MTSSYAKTECISGFMIGIAAIFACLITGLEIYAPLPAFAIVLLVWLCRSPNRLPPTVKHQIVSPADGRVRSVDVIDYFEPFDGPATRIQIYTSFLDVHVTRSPCHGRVSYVEAMPGRHVLPLSRRAAEVNCAVLTVLNHIARDVPIAAIKQIAGGYWFGLTCDAHEGESLQRGQKCGMIKMASITELYVPRPDQTTLRIVAGDRVTAGVTVVGVMPPIADKATSVSITPDTIKTTPIQSRDTRNPRLVTA